MSNHLARTAQLLELGGADAAVPLREEVHLAEERDQRCCLAVCLRLDPEEKERPMLCR